MQRETKSMMSRSSFYLWGIVLVLSGLVMIVLPSFTLGILVYAIAFLIIIRSLFVMTSSTAGTNEQRGMQGAMIFLGILGLIFGILIFLSPLFFIIAIVYLIAIALILIGIGDMIAAFSGMWKGMYRLAFIFFGLLSFIFAGILFSMPAISAIVMVQILGIYAIVVGIVDLIAGWRMRGMMHQEQTTTAY